ncbi:MAG: 2-ketoarginine methyltransferase [Candidatus Competibacteraceae bacterium]
MTTKAMPDYIPTEEDVIQGLQPLRTFVLSINLYHLFDTGLFDDLMTQGPDSVENIARRHHCDIDKLTAFFKYLRTEGILEQAGELFGLSDKGQALRHDQPYYTFFVGGYAETFLQIGEKLRENSGWATRNLEKVGVGSSGMARYDTPPILHKLIARIPGDCLRLLDIGCGQGRDLADLCEALPQIEAAYGVEPDPESCEAARALIRSRGLEDKIRVVNSSSSEFLQSDIADDPHLLILGYVIQEILGQEGREGVIEFLTRLTDRFPKLYLIVMEVDRQWDSPIMQHGYALGFYNPYYLIHAFTNQRLETAAFWEALFADCKLAILAKETIDSTRLIPVYLLRRYSAELSS